MKQVIPYVKEIVFKTNIASITSISLEHEEKIFDGEIAGDFIIFGDYKLHNDTTETEMFKYRLPFTTILPDNIKKDTIKVDIEDFVYEQIEDDVIKVNIDFSIYGDEEYQEEVEEGREETDEEVKEGIDWDLYEDDSEDNSSDDEITREIEEFLASKEDIVEDDVKEENKEDKKEDIEPMEDDRDLVSIDDMMLDPNEVQVDTLELQENKEEVLQEVKTEIKSEEKNEYVMYHIHIVKESETIEQIINMYGTNIELVKEYNEIEKIKTGDKLIIPDYVDE